MRIFCAIFRCVDPKDKSLAIGLSIFLISVLAMLPSPILFGKIFGRFPYSRATAIY